jgi:hypothetical protein
LIAGGPRRGRGREGVERRKRSRERIGPERGQNVKEIWIEGRLQLSGGNNDILPRCLPRTVNSERY